MPNNALNFRVNILKVRLNDLVGVPEKVQGEALVKAMDNARRVAVRKAKSLVPVDTGRLRKSIHSKLNKTENPFRTSVRLIADAQNERTGDYYGNYIEEGRGPVTARNAPALHFFNRKYGEWMTRVSVRSARKFPFLKPAMDHVFAQEVERGYDKFVERYFENELKRRGF